MNKQLTPEQQSWVDEWCWMYSNSIFGSVVRVWSADNIIMNSALESLLTQCIAYELCGGESQFAYRVLNAEELKLVARTVRVKAEFHLRDPSTGGRYEKVMH